MIKVRLFGGLGNQLFQYFAAKHVQNLLGCKLVFDFSSLNNGHGHTDSDIRDFSFFQSEQTMSIHNQKYLNRLYFRMCNLIARKLKFGSRLLRIDAPGRREPSISKYLKCGWKMQGYYQDFNFFNEVAPTLDKFDWTLATPSIRLNELVQIYRKSNVVGMHIRGGDYLNHQNLYSNLDSNYYQHALELVKSKIHIEKVVVFTDDMTHANRIMSKLRSCNFELAPELSPSETLILLSHCRGIVTANSTFSSWAAVASDRAEIIINPKKWYINSEKTIPLIDRAITI